MVVSASLLVHSLYCTLSPSLLQLSTTYNLALSFISIKYMTSGIDVSPRLPNLAHTPHNDIDMYLTPPSSTTSPVSSQRRLLELASSTADSCRFSVDPAAGYSSPSYLGGTTDLLPSFSSASPEYLSQAMPGSQAYIPSHDSMDHAAWATPDGLVASSSSVPSCSAETEALHADFDPFTSYDSCLPSSFPNHDGYLPTSRSSTVHQGPLPTIGSNRPPPMAERPYSYVQESSNPRMRVESSVSYSHNFDPRHYPVAGPSSAAYHADGSFAPTLPSDPGDGSATTWSKQEYDATQVYTNAQPPATDPSQERRLLKGGKTRRPQRRHTTKEEANFQCEVKGCGKFFSRSYNYKSHLETHDEKREYPFPCTVEGCNKKFVRKTDLQRHHQSVHMKERNHKCDYCGRLFARKDTLRRLVAPSDPTCIEI